MNNKVVILLVAFASFAFGLLSTNLVSFNQTPTTPTPTKMADPHDLAHESGTFNVPPGAKVPTITLEAVADAKMGYNLHIKTTNFNFTPEKVNQKNILGEGHAHLYVNGVKIGRLYGNWYHLTQLKPGDNEVIVSLNANDHASYHYNNEDISAKITLSYDPNASMMK